VLIILVGMTGMFSQFVGGSLKSYEQLHKSAAKFTPSLSIIDG